MQSKRLILGITGIRSEYDIMSSVYNSIKNDPNLDLKLVVTGAHLTEEFGLTVEEIKKDGFDIADQIPSLLSGGDLSLRVKGLAIQLQSIIQTVKRINPDLLLVLGDREESMSAALTGAYMNIPVAHIAGGDKSRTVDDQVRHAVTKLSHIHFVTNEDSAKRVVNLGEEQFRIYNVGNPGLDRFISTPLRTKEEILKTLNLDWDINLPYLMVIQHSISSEIRSTYKQIKETLEAIKELKIPTILIYPNSDPGSETIINAFDEYKDLTYFHFHKNIPREIFVNLLRNCACLIGNSSAGILEAPSMKLPVVNIGIRQEGRLHSENVLFVDHEKIEIINAIKKSLSDYDYLSQVKNCSNPYGNGKASQEIAKVLSTIDINEKLLIKELTY